MRLYHGQVAISVLDGGSLDCVDSLVDKLARKHDTGKRRELAAPSALPLFITVPTKTLTSYRELRQCHHHSDRLCTSHALGVRASKCGEGTPAGVQSSSEREPNQTKDRNPGDRE